MFARFFFTPSRDDISFESQGCVTYITSCDRSYLAQAEMYAICFLAALAWTAAASSGDRSAIFQICIQQCEARQCPNIVLPQSLRITRWTCLDDCKYTCMHDISDSDVLKNVTLQQYYGKWPFWRFLGMQEPASVAFSLLNLLTHVRGARAVRSRVPDGHPMKVFYIWSARISAVAWICSAVFHTRGACANRLP